MAEQVIRFEDGAAYEQFMGVWSRAVGEVFLDWLAPEAGLRWVDVGCGNGAFTERLCALVAPAVVEGVDPSEGQLAFARTRPGVAAARFRQGDAMDLPFGDAAFDAAVMALVIFFVPDPAKGVAEMVRVVRPGGLVCAYAWDIPGGGFPLAALWSAMAEMGLPYLQPPQAAVSQREALRAVWAAAGLREVAVREIVVQRRFADFDDYWGVMQRGSSVAQAVGSLPAEVVERLRAAVRGRLPAVGADGLVVEARANAVRGWVG